MKVYNTIEKQETSELVEKKSKFIANIFYVSTTQEAEEKLEQIRKKYYDARHNCYAYRVIEDGNIIDRSSDDGEPSGTAGAPMLNILKKENLCNVLVVVTRYFGGILLGTGGLVRAYSQSTQDVIEKSVVILKQEGYVATLEVEYKDLEKLRYFCKKKEIKIIDIKYLENVSVKLEFKKEEKEVYTGKEMVEVPVIGKITAGAPILAVENITDTFPIPLDFIGNNTCFMLTVRGESMIEAGILDGDYILVKKQNTAENGQIVVALIGDEATVKTFYKEKDHIRLQPENSTMDPIIVPTCEILGKVAGVFRKM